MCNSAESKEKLIDVRHGASDTLHVGDSVTVMAAQAVGTKAVIIAFVIPLVIMLATIAIVMRLTGSEASAAASGITIMLPYYVVLYLFRSRLERELTFYLK